MPTPRTPTRVEARRARARHGRVRVRGFVDKCAEGVRDDGRGRATGSIIDRSRSRSRSRSIALVAMAMRVTFVTGNARKLEEVRGILGATSTIEVTCASVDVVETQGEPEDVARAKARDAARALGGPALVEDTSLCFNALGGLPGVYVKWYLEKTGHEGLNNALAMYEDKSAYAQCVFAYATGPDDAEPKVFVGRTHGRIVPARGPRDFGWDPVFEPDGYDETYAEMDKATKNAISHRFRALEKFRAYVNEL